MSPLVARRMALAIWTVTVAGLAVVAIGASPEGEGATLVAVAVFVMAFATVGALVASRHPGNAVGWIMCLSGLSYALAGFALTHLEAPGLDSASTAEVTSSRTFAAWITGWIWLLGTVPAGTLLLLLFPDGRLPSARWRPLAWLSVSALALWIVSIAFAPGRLDDYPADNPVGIEGADAIGLLAGPLVFATLIASLVSLVVRYRRSHGRERQQLKWLSFAAVLVGVGLLAQAALELTIGLSDDLGNTAVTASLAAIPICIGIAILRHGLYDIDLVIRRTAVYGALTMTLVVSYSGLVLVLQQVLDPGSDFAVAGSTLAVAALFRPLRGRIQEVVDRRFYRSRYDTEQTLSGFGTRLRDEVELESVSGELRSVVTQTMQPAHVSLWLRGAPR